jgi:hypothetical protein
MPVHLAANAALLAVNAFGWGFAAKITKDGTGRRMVAMMIAEASPLFFPSGTRALLFLGCKKERRRCRNW